MFILLSGWNISGWILSCSQNDLPYCNCIYQKSSLEGTRIEPWFCNERALNCLGCGTNGKAFYILRISLCHKYAIKIYSQTTANTGHNIYSTIYNEGEIACEPN
jgi:hypothetical protein